MAGQALRLVRSQMIICDQLKAWESEGVYKEVGGLWHREKVGQGWARRGRLTGSIPGRHKNENRTKQEEAGSEAKADQARGTEKELCGFGPGLQAMALGPLLFSPPCLSSTWLQSLEYRVERRF